MHVPDHLHDTSSPEARRRALVKALADLCRRDGATFTAVVCRAEHLHTAGMEREAASWQALRELTG